MRAGVAIWIGIILSFALPLGAQNLVPNYDFTDLISNCNQDGFGTVNRRSESEYLTEWFGANNLSIVPVGRNNLMYSFVHDCKKNSVSPLSWKSTYPGNNLIVTDWPNQCDTFSYTVFPSTIKGNGYVYISVLDTFQAGIEIDLLMDDCTHSEFRKDTFYNPGTKSFLQVELDNTLRANEKYVIEYYIYPFYINRVGEFAIDDLGVYLSQDTFKVETSYKAGFSPTVIFPEIVYEQKWHHHISSFTAQGNEEFLTLGNFKRAWETNSYYFGCDSPCTGVVGANIFAFPPTYYYDAVMLYRPEDTVFNAFLPEDGRFCPGETVTLTAQDTGFKLTEPVKSYRWNTGDTTQSITVDSAGTYTVTVWYDDRWWDTASFTYRLHPEYRSGLPDTVEGCPESDVTLRAHPPTPEQALQWSTGSTGSTVQVQPPQTVVLSAITPCDTVQDTVLVTGNACPPETDAPEFRVPDAFTPNGDGLNDTWAIFDLPEDNEVWIMSRWGEVVYHQENYKGNWNGTNAQSQPLPTGVYVYKIVYYWAGRSFRDVKQGHITLLRR